jgi:hypothetical protein
MPDWTGGGADSGDTSTNTAEATAATGEAAADTTAEDTTAAAGKEPAEPSSQ